METVIQQLADEMVSALPVTVASVAIWERPSYSLRVKAVSAARPLPVPFEVGTRVLLAAARWHRAAFDRQAPVFVQPYSTTEEVSPDEACLSLIPDLHSVYLVPIRAGGETVGVLGLGEMRAPDREPFGQDKRERCHAILAEFLATSAHAWEAGRLRRQVSAMSSLAAAVARIHDVGTYQEVLGCIASEVSTKGATRLGLGLSVVRAFAERHGGTATLSSGESGTELALRLPAHRPFRESLTG